MVKFKHLDHVTIGYPGSCWDQVRKFNIGCKLVLAHVFDIEVHWMSAKTSLFAAYNFSLQCQRCIEKKINTTGHFCFFRCESILAMIKFSIKLCPLPDDWRQPGVVVWAAPDHQKVLCQLLKVMLVYNLRWPGNRHLFVSQSSAVLLELATRTVGSVWFMQTWNVAEGQSMAVGMARLGIDLAPCSSLWSCFTSQAQNSWHLHQLSRGFQNSSRFSDHLKASQSNCLYPPCTP